MIATRFPTAETYANHVDVGKDDLREVIGRLGELADNFVIHRTSVHLRSRKTISTVGKHLRVSN